MINIFKSKKFLKLNFDLKERMKIYRKISSNLDNGMDVVTCVDKLYKRLRKNKDLKQYIVLDWLKGLNNSKTFIQCLKPWLPNVEYMIISSSENLSKGLKEATTISLAIKDSKKVIISGVAFPTFLVVLLFGLFMGFRFFFADALLSIIPLDKWPEDGKQLYNISDFLARNIVFILIGLFLFFIIVSYSLDKMTGKIRKYLDYIPPYSIYKEFQSFSFLLSLSSLIQSGSSILEAYKKLKSNSSIWLGSYINLMIYKISHHEKVCNSLNVDLFNKDLMGDIEDYDGLKDFDDLIYILSKEAVVSSTEKIRMKMDIFRNVMLFAVVGTLLFMLKSIFSVQMELTNYLSTGGM